VERIVGRATLPHMIAAFSATRLDAQAPTRS
jgi:hypothetical protein